MADDNEQNGPYDGPYQYMDDSLQIAKRLGNFLSPPQQQASAAPPPATPATPTVAPTRGSMGAANPMAKAASGVSVGTPPSPSPMAPPAASPAPAAVTRTGQPSDVASKSWEDYARPMMSKLQQDQAEEQRLQASGPGVNKIGNRLLRGIAKTADVIGSAVFPGFAQWVPGTTAHNLQLQGQAQGRIGQDEAGLQSSAGLANTQSEMDERAAKAQKESAQADSYSPVTLTPEQAGAINHPELAGEQLTQKAYAAMITGSGKADSMLEQAAKAGLKPTKDANGKITGWEPDENSTTFKSQKLKDDLYSAQTELAQANADLSKAKNDPNSPAFKAAQERAQTAQANANAAQTRANAYALNSTGANLGTDTQGNALAGSTQTVAGNPMGSRFQSQYTKSQQNVAQFNDVLGATDQLENTARALVKAHGTGALSSPVVATGLSQPKGTFGQWVQGQVANGNMTPAQRDYVTNLRAFRENLQALRKSAGGGVSDAQVNRLMEMAPGASTPDIDFLLRQTKQIRSTANRLSEGVPKVTGGRGVRTDGQSGNTAPAKSPSPAKPGAGTPQTGDDPFAQFGGKAH